MMCYQFDKSFIYIPYVLQNLLILSFFKAKLFLTFVNQIALLFFLMHFQQFISHLQH